MALTIGCLTCFTTIIKCIIMHGSKYIYPYLIHVEATLDYMSEHKRYTIEMSATNSPSKNSYVYY